MGYYSLTEYLTAHFYAWEQRGRGWKVFGEPVHLESEFIPFFGHLPPERVERIDTGKRPRFFPALQEKLGLYKSPSSEAFGEIAFTKLEEIYPINPDGEDRKTNLGLIFEKHKKGQREGLNNIPSTIAV